MIPINNQPNGITRNKFEKFKKIREYKNNKKRPIIKPQKCSINIFKLVDKYESIKLILSNLNSDIECLDILYGEDLIDYFNENTSIKQNIKNTELKISKFITLLKKRKRTIY